MWAIVRRAVEDLARPKPLATNEFTLPHVRIAAYGFLYERTPDVGALVYASQVVPVATFRRWLDRWRRLALEALCEHGSRRFADWKPWTRKQAAKLARLEPDQRPWCTMIPHIAQVLTLRDIWPASSNE